MDADEMTVEDMIDALEELDDEELVELRDAANDEIADRDAGVDELDLDDEEDEEETHG